MDAHTRQICALGCVAAIFAPYVAPIVMYVLAGRQAEVRYHAARLLIQQLVATVVLAILFVASLAYSINNLVQSGVFENGIQWSKIDWVGILVKSAATWIGLALWNLYNVFGAVREAIAVHQGAPIEPRKWTERKAAALARV